MDFAEEWLELLVILIVLMAITIIGATGFYQYLDKARLTLSVAAMTKAQDALNQYKAMHLSFPASLEFSTCSDQDHFVLLSCDEVKTDHQQLRELHRNRKDNRLRNELHTFHAVLRDTQALLIDYRQSLEGQGADSDMSSARVQAQTVRNQEIIDKYRSA